MKENTVRTKSFKGLSKLKTIIKDIYSKKKQTKRQVALQRQAQTTKRNFSKDCICLCSLTTSNLMKDLILVVAQRIIVNSE